MYEAYWKLDRKPFENVADAGCYYPCEAHQGALLKLRYTIENGRGAALLAGASGVGKTMLAHTLRRQLPETYRPFAHVVFPQMSPAELLAYIAEELDPRAGADLASPSIKDSVRRIERALANNDERGQQAIVVIDEAHLVTDRAAWEALRLLGNFNEPRQRLTLLLCGQPAILPALDRMPQWEERLGVKCLLRPFTLEETLSYVTHRLTAAGARATIFDTAALEAVFYITQGNPRKINRLCDLALLIAFAEEQSSITATQIDSVAQELVTIAPE